MTRAMAELPATALTDGQRIAAALERIATCLEESSQIDPAAMLESMMSGATEVAPLTGDIVERAQEIADAIEVENNTERVELPIDGYAIVFEWTDDEFVFRLWLAGPGGTIQPLEWKHG
jgi:hypothetical protein